MPQTNTDPACAIIYKDRNMSASDMQDTGTGKVAVFSSRSPDKLEKNEDAAAIVQLDQKTSILVVADGVGGLPSGEEASSLVIDSIRRTVLAGFDSNNDLRHAILSGIETANQKIIEAGSGSATTLAIAEIRGNSIRTYHIGDSMILVTGQRGRLKMETISHSPVGYAVEAGILTHEDAIHHDERHLVSNVVGDPDMHISMGIPFQLAPRDTLLLASDGLFDNIRRDEIIDIVRKGSLQTNADRLAQTARGRMQDESNTYKPDDLTFILYRRAGSSRRRKQTGSND